MNNGPFDLTYTPAVTACKENEAHGNLQLCQRTLEETSRPVTPAQLIQSCLLEPSVYGCQHWLLVDKRQLDERGASTP